MCGLGVVKLVTVTLVTVIVTSPSVTGTKVQSRTSHGPKDFSPIEGLRCLVQSIPLNISEDFNSVGGCG